MGNATRGLPLVRLRTGSEAVIRRQYRKPIPLMDKRKKTTTLDSIRLEGLDPVYFLFLFTEIK